MKSKTKIIFGLASMFTIFSNTNTLAGTITVNERETDSALEITSNIDKDTVSENHEDSIISEETEITTESEAPLKNSTDVNDNKGSEDKASPKILTLLDREISWAADTYRSYGEPKLKKYYEKDLTLLDKTKKLGVNKGDSIEGYIDLPIYMVSYYKGCTIYHGIDYGIAPTIVHNDVAFNFSGYDTSAYEVKMEESKTQKPSTPGVNIPTSTGANIGNTARYFITVKRLKNATEAGVSQLEIPSQLIWKTQQNYDNGWADTKYYPGWSAKFSSTYNIPLEMSPVLETKNSEIYIGEKYESKSNYISGFDMDGNEIKWGDPNLVVQGDDVDTNTPGIYPQQLIYTYTNIAGISSTVTSDYTVEVKEDKSSITTKDVSLYTGQNWKREDNFVSATDEDGNDVPWSDNRISSNSAEVDTSVSGEYTFRYTFKGKVKNTDSTTKVTVKEDKSSITTKDVELFVGESWTRADNFVSATDEDGNDVPWVDVRIDTHNAQVDTSVPNEYIFTYTFKGKVKHTDAITKVTVKENVLSLATPDDFSFGNAVLGEDKKLYWDKKSEVTIDNEGNRNWDLTTKLAESSSQDFSNYLKFKDQSFSDGSVLIDSGTSSKNITNELTEENFIYVDYSSIKSIRKDTATLEWTLSPSTKEVEE